MILAAAYLGDLIHLPLLSFAGCVFCLPSKVIYERSFVCCCQFLHFSVCLLALLLVPFFKLLGIGLNELFLQVSPSFCWDSFLLPFSCTQASFTSLEECCFHFLLIDGHFFLIRMRVVLQICQGLKLFLQMQNKGTSNFRVLYFLHVKPLLSGSFIPCFPQLHSQFCHNHIVITANVSSPLLSDLHKWPLPGTVDHEVVYLFFIPFVGRLPCQLVDIFVWKECSSDEEVVNCAEFHQPLSILINGTTALSSYGSLVVGVISSNLCIHVPHHNVHVMPWYFF